MTNYITFFLRLRFLQLGRVIRALGMGYALVLFFIIGLLSLGLMQKLDNQKSIYWCLLVVLPALSVHQARRDWCILYNAPLKSVYILFIEYFLLSLPLAMLIAYFQGYSVALLGIFLSTLVAFLPVKYFGEATKAMTFGWLPLKDFEWRMGLRKLHFSAFLPFLVLPTIPVFEGGILLFTFFSAMMSTTFYHYAEPKEWIDKDFSIDNKILRHLIFWTLCWLPAAILHLIAFPRFWYFLPITWVFTAILIFSCITFKYAKWQPNRYFSGVEKVGNMYFGMMFVIFTSPIPLLAGIYYWIKAKRNIFLK
jgi:hypothetical protein